MCQPTAGIRKLIDKMTLQNDTTNGRCNIMTIRKLFKQEIQRIRL